MKASLLCTDACSCGHCKNKSMIDGNGPAEKPEDYDSGGEDSDENDD